MKDTLLYILRNIVDYPDDIIVDEVQQDGRTTLTVHANTADMGKIIGKSGRIIKALRDLIKLIATKRGTYVDVVLADERQTSPT